MNKKETPITSSIGFYCLACTILTAMGAGLTNVFWIYLFLALIFGGAAMYQIYRLAKANNENSVTYYFFAADHLALGLLMVTFYFDYKFRFINMNQDSIIMMLFVIGSLFIISEMVKKFKK